MGDAVQRCTYRADVPTSVLLRCWFGGDLILPDDARTKEPRVFAATMAAERRPEVYHDIAARTGKRCAGRYGWAHPLVLIEMMIPQVIPYRNGALLYKPRAL